MHNPLFVPYATSWYVRSDRDCGSIVFRWVCGESSRKLFARESHHLPPCRILEISSLGDNLCCANRPVLRLCLYRKGPSLCLPYRAPTIIRMGEAQHLTRHPPRVPLENAGSTCPKPSIGLSTADRRPYLGWKRVPYHIECGQHATKPTRLHLNNLWQPQSSSAERSHC